MLTHKQIQNYIGYRRRLIGDNNNLDEIADFVKGHQYTDDSQPDDLIIFGETLAEGSDKEPFHMGINLYNYYINSSKFNIFLLIIRFYYS